MKNTKGTVREHGGNTEGTQEEHGGNLYKLLNKETIKLINKDATLVNDNLKKWIDSEKENNKPVKKYSLEVEVSFKNCLNYFPAHLQPENKKAETSWKETLRKLNEIDNIPFQIIEEIVKRTRQDSFWSQHFLSLNKLRAKDKNGIMYIVVFGEKFKQKATVEKTSIEIMNERKAGALEIIKQMHKEKNNE